MRATPIFKRDDGISVFVWRAAAALRIRVNMSAMGSVNIMVSVVAYQLLLITPGSSPSNANWRKQMRHSLNLRM